MNLELREKASQEKKKGGSQREREKGPAGGVSAGHG